MVALGDCLYSSPMDADTLALALAAIIGDESTPPRAAADMHILSEIRGALPRLLAAEASDQAGSLTRADLYRIRAAKLIARLLPPGSLADRERRRRIRAAIRIVISNYLGAPLAESLYLDRPTQGPPGPDT